MRTICLVNPSSVHISQSILPNSKICAACYVCNFFNLRAVTGLPSVQKEVTEIKKSFYVYFVILQTQVKK